MGSAKRHIFLCCLIFSGLMPPPASGQASAYAALKPAVVETGDTVQLTVIVSGAAAQPRSVDFGPWSGLIPADNVLSRTTWRKSGTQWLQQFTLIVFDSAELKLPGLPVLVSTGKLLTTNELTLSVYPTKGNELADMAPIRAIYREPETWMDYWPWAAGGLALLLVLVWFVRRNSRKPKPVAQPVYFPPPVVSPRETALAKLSELEGRRLWKNGEEKEHHAAISMILREYLEKEYGISALESTTSEILEMLKITRFDPASGPVLKELLLGADLVKYARSEMPESAHQAALNKARDWLGVRQQTVHEKATRNSSQPQKPATGKYEPL